MHRMLMFRIVAFFTFAFLPAHPSYGRSPDLTDSIAESKKQHVFRRSVRVSPQNFEWEGHKIAIVECWMEGFWLRFKFAFDGNTSNQNRIQHKEHKYLKFDQEIPEPGYSASSYASKRGLDYVFGGTNGETIYNMRLKQPEPNQIRLKVFTTKIDRTTKPMVKTLPSDTTLTFFLDEAETQ